MDEVSLHMNKKDILHQCMQDVLQALDHTNTSLSQLQEQKEELEKVHKTVENLHSHLDTTDTLITKVEKPFNPFKIINYSRHYKYQKRSMQTRARSLDDVILSGSFLKKSNWVKRWNRRYFTLRKHCLSFRKKSDDGRNIEIPLLRTHRYFVDYSNLEFVILTRHRIRYEFRFHTITPLRVLVRHIQVVKHLYVQVMSLFDSNAQNEFPNNHSGRSQTPVSEYTPLMDSLEELLYKQHLIRNALQDEDALLRTVSETSAAARSRLSTNTGRVKNLLRKI